MVIEHTFITTLPPEVALRKAAELLSRGGFAAQTQNGFAMDNVVWTTIDVRRGKTDIRKARTILEVPQNMRIEWDRGRVTVAASIGDRHSLKKRTALMLSIVNSLDSLLAKGQDEEDAGREWLTIEAGLRKSGGWYKARRVLLRVAVIFIWVGVIFLFAWLRRR